ncbi:MAG: hypothetical protein BGO43_16120 [Gammaproteobacteria bacterium 39-13]|nr:hypothetical protein [Gammaproteobacteria bacterium]OJV87928.1 MAG: hypothetical protein BGO43_16120 [Gammaproteobacteria bacterium 39-13]
MKATLYIFGILLILFGIFTLSYEHFSYTKNEQVAQFGDLKVTAETRKTVFFPPLLGGLSIASGLALLVIGKFNNKK